MGTYLDRNIIARFTKQCLRKVHWLLQCHDRSGRVLFRAAYVPYGLELKLTEVNGKIYLNFKYEPAQGDFSNSKDSRLNSLASLFLLWATTCPNFQYLLII